jgi:hypothetical protein
MSPQKLVYLRTGRVACAVRVSSHPPNPMATPVDPSGRAATPCQNCQSSGVAGVVLAGEFVYLRCTTCGWVWTIPDRRASVRSEDARKVFRW